MSNLADLPSLGGPGPGLGGRAGGFGGGFGMDKVEDDSNDGFTDFNINEDVIGDSSNKLDNAEKYLMDHDRE